MLFCPVVNSINPKMIERKTSDVKAFLNYRYLMKHVGIEIWFYNKKRSILLVFTDTPSQAAVFDFLAKNCTKTHLHANNDVEAVAKLW